MLALQTRGLGLPACKHMLHWPQRGREASSAQSSLSPSSKKSLSLSAVKWAACNHKPPTSAGEGCLCPSPPQKALFTFPSLFFSLCFFFVVLSFKQGTKHEGILGRMEASSLLHRMPKCSLQQMLSLGRGHASHSHLLKGHSQGGIKWAVPPSAKLCVTHGVDRLVWGAAMFPREKSTFCNWVVRPT